MREMSYTPDPSKPEERDDWLRLLSAVRTLSIDAIRVEARALWFAHELRTNPLLAEDLERGAREAAGAPAMTPNEFVRAFGLVKEEE